MDQDFAFVDPERRAEVERRLDAVRRFLEAPGRARAVALGAELGLGPGQFYRLVQAWRSSGRPEDLAGAVRRKERTVSSFRADEEELLRRLDEDDADAPVEAVARAAQLRLAELGRSRSLAPLRRLAAETRRRRLAGEAAGIGIAIENCALDMAVLSSSGSATMPIASLAIDLERRALAGIALDADQATPAAAARALSQVLLRPPDADPMGAVVPVSLPAIGPGGWADLEAALTAHGTEVSVRRGAGRLATALLGPDVLGVRLRSTRTGRPSERRTPGGAAVAARWEATPPVDARLAERVLRARLDATAAPGSPMDRLGEANREGLLAVLLLLGGQGSP